MYQPTLPAFISRKRKIDDGKDDQECASSSSDFQNKRRSVEPRRSIVTADLHTPDKGRISPNNMAGPSTSTDTFSASCSGLQLLAHSIVSQSTPMPELGLAEPTALWKYLLLRDLESSTLRGTALFGNHPQIQPRMRSILLDWLIEVSDVYKLHRETYYLAQDYIDRVLMAEKDIPKQDLQLLGITSLFIAAKVEEIYPPKVHEFAYVTDGACTESNILDYEKIILMVLQWDLSPMVPISWLRFYLQLACHDPQWTSLDFEYPRFPGSALPSAAKLLDLATLDPGCLMFRYSALAASALALIYGKQLALATSRFEWSELRPCIEWMSVFLVAIKSGPADGEAPASPVKPELRPTHAIGTEDRHYLQNHAVSLELLELAQAMLNVQQDHLDTCGDSVQDCIETTPCRNSRRFEVPDGILTPPASQDRLPVGSKPILHASKGLRPTELFGTHTSAT